MSGVYHRVSFKGELKQYSNWRRTSRCPSGSRALSHWSCHHGHLESCATPAGGLGTGAFFFSFQIAHKGSQLPVQQPSWRFYLLFWQQLSFYSPKSGSPGGKDLVGGHALKFLPSYDYIIPCNLYYRHVCGCRKAYTVFPLRFIPQ